MTYKISKETKSEVRVGKYFYAFDFLFLVGYLFVSYILASLVVSRLYVPYAIFSVAMALFLTMPSRWNRRRRNYQSLIILLMRDRGVYRPVVRKGGK